MHDDILGQIAGAAQDLLHKTQGEFQDLEHRAESTVQDAGQKMDQLKLAAKQEFDRDTAAARQEFQADLQKAKTEYAEAKGEGLDVLHGIEDKIEHAILDKVAAGSQTAVEKAIDYYHDCRRKNATMGRYAFKLSIFAFSVDSLGDHIDALTNAKNNGVHNHDDVLQLVYALAPDTVGLDFSAALAFIIESDLAGFEFSGEVPLKEIEIHTWAFLRHFVGIEIHEPDALPAS